MDPNSSVAKECSEPPISKLNVDVLMQIFSINVELHPPIPKRDYPNYEPRSMSPLTNTRCCSQVCKFWRSIILGSPLLWANSIDLDTLRQRKDTWRREVLRRTGTALLVVRSTLAPELGTAMERFAMDMICANWERMKVLDIAVDSPSFLKSVKVKFRRPARNLYAFAITSLRLGTAERVLEGALFAGKAPRLSIFSITSSSSSHPYREFPFAPILFTNHLCKLTLDDPLIISAPALLAACASMPSLEELSLVIERITAAATSEVQSISLPRLKSLRVRSDPFSIFPEFLGRIIARPSHQFLAGCSLGHIRSWDDAEQNSAAYIERIPKIIVSYLSIFFEDNNSALSRPTCLDLNIRDNLVISVYAQSCSIENAYFRMTVSGRRPSGIDDAVVQALLTVDFPSSLTRLHFEPPNLSRSHTSKIPSLAPIFHTLNSITDLHTTVKGLSYIVSVSSQAKGHIFFRNLHTVILMDSIQDTHFYSASTRLVVQSFFAHRYHVSPVSVLDLTSIPRQSGDLRYLEELEGLKVVWKAGVGRSGALVIREYVCGSGDPEQLVIC
ncbi:hypothetical protein BDN70DRAFT_884015 [Pholiota conissans]|uniref:F-box domain-containing protein n=1 Tax=Pholiota conissans TaxID=109636 RepID=A0A9P5YST4_9AGAR|nr:hypothetical protein BDN70DRAFT_884015 [Pholiota conissans]